MTTWNFRCLVPDCDGYGEGDSYDDVIEKAQTHNAEAEHELPAMSYGNDDPVEVTE